MKVILFFAKSLLALVLALWFLVVTLYVWEERVLLEMNDVTAVIIFFISVYVGGRLAGMCDKEG